MFKVMNFSPHKLDEKALNELFKGEPFQVVGYLPTLPDIGNYNQVKAVVKTIISVALKAGPTHIFVACHPSLEKLIHQCINNFSELHVPHLIYDGQQKRYWLAPPPMSRQDRQDIEFGNSEIEDPQLREWAERMKAV